MMRISDYRPAGPDVAALGPSWIKIGNVNADMAAGDAMHDISAAPGTIIVADGGCTIPEGSKTIELRRWWTLRVTGDVKHDYATLALMPFTPGLPQVTIEGAELVATSDNPPAK